MTKFKIVAFLSCLLMVVFSAGRIPIPDTLAQTAETYYVATVADGGSDSNDGSAGSPWATITHALDSVPDGSLILVRPGTYTGRTRLRGNFTTGVTVRSEIPYQARLRRNDGQVVTCFYGRGITLEGFDIAHSGPGALVVQIQDLLDGPDRVSYITLRNNIIHSSYNNDILKINNGAGHITVTGNMFFNQEGSDEHMDVNSVTDVVIENNVFFNHDNPNSGTSAYVVVKDSNGDSDGILGSERVTIRRNVFLNWEGNNAYGFLQIGEDGTANFEARDVLIENNLMIGNSANTIRSAMVVMGSRDITFRNNTIVGDMPGRAYAMSLYAYGSNQPIENIQFYNNIWADPTGSMDYPFAASPAGETASFTLDNNLYWNDGAAIPYSGSDVVNYTDDANRIIDDPLLGSQAGLVVPHWDGTGFADGSSTIREAFERLVGLYGTPAMGSAVVDAADPANAPADDIFGNSRSIPDIGAVEFVPALSLSARPGDGMIHLSWGVSATLPATSTWHIDYYTTTAVFTATDPLSITRAYTLTGLTNYQWYTVTLHAMMDSTSFLSDTVRVMPTDILVHLPLVLGE